MELRKLICFGKGSYVVSLPKNWVAKNKLKKGSVLSLDADARSLVITTNLTEEEVEKKTTVINADNKSLEELETEIVTAYLNDFDIIEIISKRVKESGSKIKDVIMNLAGLEIMEYTQTKITAKYLMDKREISLDSLIRRMDNITRSVIIDAIDCVNGKKNYDSIKQRDDDVKRLYFLVLRTVRAIVNSSKLDKDKTLWQFYTYVALAEKLEKISDWQKKISKSLENINLAKDFAPELTDTFQNIKESYVDVMKSYYQNDKRNALQIEIKNRQRLIACERLLGKDRHQMVEKKNPEEEIVVTDILTNLRDMAGYVQNIARTVLNNE